MTAVTPAQTLRAHHAYRAAIETPVSAIASELQTLLSRRLTAYIGAVKDAKAVARWADAESGVRPKSEQRLRTAYEIVQMFRENGESDQTIKAWFLGLSPHLDDVPPAEAIHEGRLKEALAAARAFVSDSY